MRVTALAAGTAALLSASPALAISIDFGACPLDTVVGTTVPACASGPGGELVSVGYISSDGDDLSGFSTILPGGLDEAGVVKDVPYAGDPSDGLSSRALRLRDTERRNGLLLGFDAVYTGAQVSLVQDGSGIGGLAWSIAAYVSGDRTGTLSLFSGAFASESDPSTDHRQVMVSLGLAEFDTLEIDFGGSFDLSGSPSLTFGASTEGSEVQSWEGVNAITLAAADTPGGDFPGDETPGGGFPGDETPGGTVVPLPGALPLALAGLAALGLLRRRG